MKDFEKWATDSINELVADVKKLQEESLKKKIREKIKGYEVYYNSLLKEERTQLNYECRLVTIGIIDELKRLVEDER